MVHTDTARLPSQTGVFYIDLLSKFSVSLYFLNFRVRATMQVNIYQNMFKLKYKHIQLCTI